MTVEEEIAAKLSNEIARHIDFEILLDVLIACGWTKVDLKFSLNRKRSIDILEWCEENTQGKYKRQDGTFIFEDQGDAVNFTLRWA
jgi:hypothetical protein